MLMTQSMLDQGVCGDVIFISCYDNRLRDSQVVLVHADGSTKAALTRVWASREHTKEAGRRTVCITIGAGAKDLDRGTLFSGHKKLHKPSSLFFYSSIFLKILFI